MEARDKLTQLYTDDFLRSGLDNELMRARRFKRELALLLLQPEVPSEVRQDMFYAVLKQLGRIVEDQTRQIDMGIRWGHQILLVLPETTREGAVKVCEKIKEGFEKINFTHPDTGQQVKGALLNTISVFPEDGEDRDTLLFKLREEMRALTDH